MATFTSRAQADNVINNVVFVLQRRQITFKEFTYSYPVPADATYKLRGWNPSSNQYEVWLGYSPFHPNPSGNTLVSVTYTRLKISGV